MDSTEAVAKGVEGDLGCLIGGNSGLSHSDVNVVKSGQGILKSQLQLMRFKIVSKALIHMHQEIKCNTF